MLDLVVESMGVAWDSACCKVPFCLIGTR